jgi:sec-independent protein translocase protein TatA
MSPSIWQILIIAALALLFFGRGRLSELMGDLGKGITSFKKGLRDDDQVPRTGQQARVTDERTLDPTPVQPRTVHDRPAEQPTMIHPAGEGTAEPAPTASEVRPAASGERREP